MPEKHVVIEKLTVTDSIGTRLSDYAVGRFEALPSRKSVKKAIKRGLLLVNDNVSQTAHRVVQGEVLTVIADETSRPVYKREIPVLYQDDYMAAVRKPADLSVSGNTFRTLQNALAYNLEKTKLMDALAVPRPVHRLDRLTGGVVLIAKTTKAATNLGEQFEERSIEKTYLTWVSGRHDEERRYDAPVDGKEALTAVKTIKMIDHNRYGELTLLEAKPKTGRRNQIRMHLAQAGHPILGDLKFEGRKSGKGLFLFAKAIEFNHPKTGIRTIIETKVPKKFNLI